MVSRPDWEPLEPAAARNLERLQDLLIGCLRRYHRWELNGQLDFPHEQVLVVGNHGFGGLFDLNVAALMAGNRQMGITRPTTALVHQVAWILGLGPVIEPFFARPASREAALDGFARGHNVLVLPGGDVDAFKARPDRNRIVFGGRSGFARLAMEAGVPIVPVVTSGAGDTLLVLNDGQKLAKLLRLDTTARLKTLPISLSFPWGLNFGLVGLLPYLPLPRKMRTRVLPPMRPEIDESPEQFAARVATVMQEALDEISSI